MNRLAILAMVLTAFAAGCGSKNPAAATNANQVKFTAALLPANEQPAAIVGAEAAGKGSVAVTFNLTKDSAGAITAATADFSFDATGFPAGTPINLAHIHSGNSTVAGPIVVNTGLAAGEIVLVNGSQTGINKNGISMTAVLAQDIINNPSQYYFNIHSQANGGGVARGQLVKQ